MFPANSGGHVARREVSGLQLLRVQPDPDLSFLKPTHHDRSHSGNGLKSFFHHLIGVAGNPAIISPAGDGNPHKGCHGHIDFLNNGSLEIPGETGLGHIHLVSNLLSTHIDILAQHKLDHDLGVTLSGGGLNGLDAFNGVDLFLQNVGDVRIHNLRIGSPKGGGDRHGGEFNFGIEIDPHVQEGDIPKDKNSSGKEDGRDRTFNCRIGKKHIIDSPL